MLAAGAAVGGVRRWAERVDADGPDGSSTAVQPYATGEKAIKASLKLLIAQAK